MIKRAVEQRADDGYIVDSLGWAYYRLKVRGRWREAKRQAWRDLLQLKAALDDTTEGKLS